MKTVSDNLQTKETSDQDSLKIFTLGGLSIQRGAIPLTGFASRKVEALLVYLACTKHPQPREVLAELLWDERSQDRAMGNLRVVLTSLRKQLSPFVTINRDSVELNPDAKSWLDTAEMERLLGTAHQKGIHPRPTSSIQQLEQAVALYNGKFLDGFYVRKCAGFESWFLREQERLHRLILDALLDLVSYYADRWEFKTGTAHAARLLELDPMMEEAHRLMMYLLACSGQRGKALKQYQICSQILNEELGVQPTEGTRILFQQIQNGEIETSAQISAPEASPLWLPFLEETSEAAEARHPIFVDREQDIKQLHGFLEGALTGQGQVVFITGEAGSGKTALILEFARQAQEKFADLVVALGNCNDYAGTGDPYLPFRDVMGMLTGDIESKWISSAITQVHARRLWALVPYSVQALVSHGSDLIDVFVPASELLSRAKAAAAPAASWLEQLQLLSERQVPAHRNLEQSHLFEQYTNVLRTLAAHQPLLILVDDLHWTDAASINLLFHLGRELAGSPILIVGAYRPEEVALGRDGNRHPLEKLLSELKRHFGEVWVDLDETDEDENLGFVESYLDTEPNSLGQPFRKSLFKHTGGHPLFTIELLRDLQKRGDLIKDEQARWVEGPDLDWSILPARVEGVIEERIARLDDSLRETLTIASVVGVNFNAQVIGWVLNIGERDLVGQLSRELDRKHRLIEEIGSRKVSDWQLYMYRFRHTLFQQHLYNSIGDIERQLLHAEVGVVLESIYGENVGEISTQLAWHFAKAGELIKAVHYLLITGDRARQLYAHEEAIENYQRALDYLMEQGEYEQAARTLMKIGLTYHTAFDFQRSRQAYDEGFALRQRSVKSLPAAHFPVIPHTLRMDWEKGPVTLDPALTLDRPTSQLIDLLFSGLVELGSDFDVEPDVAHSWKVLEEGRKYIFHLREDVRWSDGTTVTAEDFVFAWMRTLDPDNKISITAGLFDILGAKEYKFRKITDPHQVQVRAVDPFILEVALDGPTGFFPYLLTQPICHPVPKHIVAEHGDSWSNPENIVTNGPFTLDSMVPGEPIILLRNPDYHGHFSGNLQRLELFLDSDHQDRLAEYEADGLDVLRLDPEIEHARHAHIGEYISGPSLYTTYLGFKLRRAPFDDPRVRQAFVMASNRETLASVILKGCHTPASGGFVPPGLPGHSPDIGLPYDPERARQLLTQAGYPDGQDFPAVLLQAHEGNREQAEFLQAQWLRYLNVNVEVIVLDWALFLKNLDSTHLLLSRWVADYPDPDNFLRVALSRRIGNWDDTYQNLVETARHITDQSERMKLYTQADQILVEKAAIMPLTYARSHILVKPWVNKLDKSPLDYWSCKDATIEPWDINS
jgi:ABC-type oligopeptide transport system substrate-binding subunit/DNA-binding SARP family transcriptional activator